MTDLSASKSDRQLAVTPVRFNDLSYVSERRNNRVPDRLKFRVLLSGRLAVEGIEQPEHGVTQLAGAQINDPGYVGVDPYPETLDDPPR